MKVNKITKDEFVQRLKDPWQYNLRKKLNKIVSVLERDHPRRIEIDIDEITGQTDVKIVYKPYAMLSLSYISRIFDEHLNILIDTYSQNEDSILYGDLVHNQNIKTSILSLKFFPK